MQRLTLQMPDSYTGELFKAQKSLMDHYIVIEALPQYPVPLPMKKSQKLLRDFVGRITEELAEAHAELSQLNLAMCYNQTPKAKTFIEQYNEEIADAFHFMLELLVFSGIDENNINDYFYKFVQTTQIVLGREETTGDGLKDAFKWVQLLSSFSGNKASRQHISTFTVPVGKEPWSQGGKYISNSILTEHSELLWAFTCDLYKAINLLKHKDWTQSEVKKLNELEFRERLFGAFMTMICYLDYANIDEQTLYHNYMFKNKLNHERISSGY